MTLAILPILLAAAFLEAGGDALIRLGLHAHAAPRALFLLAGALVLFSYGLTVNASVIDFGKLLGLYVVAFFLAAQLINLVLFRAAPDLSTIAGGALIVAGGLVISLAP